MEKIKIIIKFSLVFYFFFSKLLFSQGKSIEKTDLYMPFLLDKNIGLVVNQNSNISNVHLIDSLIALGLNVKSIFSPEHGFNVNFAAGENIKNEFYKNIPIFSLYGKKKKPSSEMMSNLDVILFDIQDVGVRFYTYISTLHYVMESCAENNVPLIVLDRDNLHSNYVDGPILNKEFKSFVGMHPVPVLYGMTIGEYALMINGEYWLVDSLICDLKVIKFQEKINYLVTDSLLPFPPSPNLKTNLAIKLYPTLCFFEGTSISVGRGTDFPFQVIGAPDYKDKNIEKLINNTNDYIDPVRYSFYPISREECKNPKFENEDCFGVKFHLISNQMNIKKIENLLFSKIDIDLIIQFYKNYPKNKIFFSSFFNTLAGNSTFQKKIKSGWSAEEIRSSWNKDIEGFLEIRKKYLLYPRN